MQLESPHRSPCSFHRWSTLARCFAKLPGSGCSLLDLMSILHTVHLADRGTSFNGCCSNASRSRARGPCQHSSHTAWPAFFLPEHVFSAASASATLHGTDNSTHGACCKSCNLLLALLGPSQMLHARTPRTGLMTQARFFPLPVGKGREGITARTPTRLFMHTYLLTYVCTYIYIYMCNIYIYTVCIIHSTHMYIYNIYICIRRPFASEAILSHLGPILGHLGPI